MVDVQITKAHGNFSFPDADVTFQSSDGVLFRLHRKNLEVATGTFPGSEFNSEEVVLLPEHSTVLEVLFQFIYLKRYPPTLEGMDFEILMDVAEAAEKYQVFWAMKACEDCLTELLLDRGIRILVHAIKHDISELINKAALSLSRSALSEVLKALPAHCVVPWAEYSDAWKKVFGEARQTMIARGAIFAGMQCSQINTTQTQCHVCTVCLISWVAKLENIRTLSSLKDAVNKPVLYPKDSTANESFIWCRACIGNSCIHRGEVVKILETGMEALSPFTTFLHPDDRNTA